MTRQEKLDWMRQQEWYQELLVRAMKWIKRRRLEGHYRYTNVLNIGAFINQND